LTLESVPASPLTRSDHRHQDRAGWWAPRRVTPVSEATIRAGAAPGPYCSGRQGSTTKQVGCR
jgi:hypothetical protein